MHSRTEHRVDEEEKGQLGRGAQRGTEKAKGGTRLQGDRAVRAARKNLGQPLALKSGALGLPANTGQGEQVEARSENEKTFPEEGGLLKKGSLVLVGRAQEERLAQPAGNLFSGFPVPQKRGEGEGQKVGGGQT